MSLGLSRNEELPGLFVRELELVLLRGFIRTLVLISYEPRLVVAGC